MEKEQVTKELGGGFELGLLNLFPVLWLIWSNMTIQALIIDKPALTAVIMTILAVVGDTITSCVSNMISTDTAFCHYHFSPLKWICTANRKNHCQSWIEHSCTRWQ